MSLQHRYSHAEHSYVNPKSADLDRRSREALRIGDDIELPSMAVNGTQGPTASRHHGDVAVDRGDCGAKAARRDKVAAAQRV